MLGSLLVATAVLAFATPAYCRGSSTTIWPRSPGRKIWARREW